MVADLAAVKDRRRVDWVCMQGIAGEMNLPRNRTDQRGQHLPHIIRQVPAVGPGVGDQLLFIEALGIVQSLLGCEAEHSVSIALQAGQIV